MSNVRAHYMRTVTAITVACLSAAGCAPTYRIGTSPVELDRVSAEAAHISAANAQMQQQPAARFDSPLKLLRAPQPALPRADALRNQLDEVVVDIHFNELGLVERAVVVRSTGESLTETVIAATSQWQIEPAKRAGQAVKVVVRQSFAFDTR